MQIRRSNFAQCIERAPVNSGEKFAIEWLDHRYENGCYIAGKHYRLIQPYQFNMSVQDHNDMRTARLDAKIEQAATKNVPYACPDLDQDYTLDTPSFVSYHRILDEPRHDLRSPEHRAAVQARELSNNPYHPYQSNFKGQVP